jgi:hypothetical protein
MNRLFRDALKSSIRKTLEDSQVVQTVSNPSAKGRAREVFVTNLLRPYISPTVSICTGCITDYEGGQSRQIDIILFDKTVIPPLMLTEIEGIVPVESVLATVEVKSLLTRTELRKSMENARSIKLLEPLFAEIKRSDEPKRSPPAYVFAFKSDLGHKSEYQRLKEVVDHSNRDGRDKVYVPVSALCVPGKALVYCTEATKEPKFCEREADNEYGEVVEFLMRMVDTASLLSLQRNPIFFAPYVIAMDG